MTDYKPGTVAVATVRGIEGTRIFRTGWPARGKWIVAETSLPKTLWLDPSDVTDVRPLVVLDPENPSLRYFVQSWKSVAPQEESGTETTVRAARYIADQIEAQIKPPRIPEPGWSEKVLAHTLDDPTPREYVRFTISRNQFSTRQWYGHGGSQAQRWDDLIDPVLVREGVA